MKKNFFLNGVIRGSLNLIRKSKRGKFKIYTGMSAGVGKTFRMLQEAHSLLKNNVNLKMGI